jgi:hypothetical protein
MDMHEINVPGRRSEIDRDTVGFRVMRTALSVVNAAFVSASEQTGYGYPFNYPVAVLQAHIVPNVFGEGVMEWFSRC